MNLRRSIWSIALVAALAGGPRALAWGELGHHLIGRTAAKLLRYHPTVKALLDGKDQAAKQDADELVKRYEFRWFQQGYVSNIPDIYWRNLDGGIKEDGNLLGAPTHYINLDRLLPNLSPGSFSAATFPLDYQQAKEHFAAVHPELKFFSKIGTNPWRAQQFDNLYRWAMEHYPKETCEDLKISEDAVHPTRAVMTYAGLMSHFVGDSAQPYHATLDHDGVLTGQAGIHWYFENELVDANELGLDREVFERARALLTAPESEPHSVAAFRKLAERMYPNAPPESRVVALVLAELTDSYANVGVVRDADARYALAPLKEALTMPDCEKLPQVLALKAKYDEAKSSREKHRLAEIRIRSEAQGEKATSPACRRDPKMLVNAKGEKTAGPKARRVAAWSRDFIVERLAIGASLLTDIWARDWAESHHPRLCFTWQYATKPPFVSPTDPNCFGYALKEDPKDYLKSDGKSALPYVKSAKALGECQ